MQNYITIDFMTLLVILIIVLVIIIFLAWKVIYNAKAKERILAIEKGYDLTKLPNNDGKPFNFPWIKIGVIISSACIGYFIGGTIESFTDTIYANDREATLFTGNGTLSLLFMYLFAGLGMIFSNRFTKK